MGYLPWGVTRRLKELNKRQWAVLHSGYHCRRGESEVAKVFFSSGSLRAKCLGYTAGILRRGLN